MNREPAVKEPTVRVAIVEDDAALREGLGTLIAGTDGYRLTGAYGSVEEAMGPLAKDTPDVLLLDINLPGMQGSQAVRPLRQQFGRMQVLMLTIFAEQDHVFESICNGASGYLLKKTPPARLLEAIREAHDGGSPMSPEIARKVVTLFQQTRGRAEPHERLTPHEVRLLKLLAEGHSYQSAGTELGCSINTVRNYIRSIYEKLHVHSKSEAVTRALRSGLIA
ncbi:MAG TPA: response regulator transcription factor [Patescibacteria group bacterium]|nr:response regulator transcription factor [Patescibacteria group bacterium]